MTHSLPSLAPSLTTFPSVDALTASFRELAAAAPTLVTRTVVGHSRAGEPLESYAIGHGSRHAVVAGGVHPNEPIGFHTALELARRLVADTGLRESLDLTWHIVPCIDPDGTRLNETWFDDPADRVFYGRHFYRPAPDEQIEWTFPLDYKRLRFDRPLPETRALMEIFDAVRPVLFVGLHNAEIGGVYYYLNDGGALDLAETLRAIPARHGVPLDVGEPESPDLEAIAPSVFRAPLAAEHYDYVEGLGLDPVADASGGGSADYLQQYGTLTLVAELPYWTHPDATDTSPGDRPYVDVIAQKAAQLRDLSVALTAVLGRVGDALSIPSPFLRAARAFAPAMGGLADIEEQRSRTIDPSRVATRAEQFANTDVVRCFRLRFGGVLLRALEAECRAGVATDAVRLERDAFAVVYDAWAAEAATVPLETIPIHRLVGIQLDATLAAADWAVRR